MHPSDSPLPTNPELVLGENNRAYVAYGNTVGGFQVSNGAGGWNYAAINDITVIAATDGASLVAKTRAPDGTDTILKFFDSGVPLTSTLGVANISHVVKDLWITSDVSGATGPLQGENIDWATTGWFQATGRGQRRVWGRYKDSLNVPGHQQAALDIMPDLQILSSKWEYGVRVCRDGAGTYSWAKIVTSENPGSVDTATLSVCAGTTVVANVHTHIPLALGGEVEPSHQPSTASDINTADNNPAIVYYLAAPELVGFEYRYFRYQRGQQPCSGTCSALYNTFLWLGSSWAGYNYPP